MKKILLLPAMLFILSVAAQQTPPAKNNREAARQPQDWQKALEDARKKNPELDKILKEQGIDKNLQTAAAATSYNGGKMPAAVQELPQKDMTRINNVSKKIMGNGELNSYTQKLTDAVGKRITPASKKIADLLYQQPVLKNAAVKGNTACGLWMLGNPQAAVYLMARACSDDISNTDNLNNLAAFLIMTGAEDAALPILFVLNGQFHNNSTILNNIGQAWIGLGDIATGEKYLDSATRMFPGHAQANYAKAAILESKGNKAGAVTALKKSLQTAYSPVKVTRLNNLHAGISNDDLTWNFRMPPDALGLEKIVAQRPLMYKNMDDQLYHTAGWEAFHESLASLKKALEQRITSLKPAVKKEEQQQQELAMNVSKRREYYYLLYPPLKLKAMQKLRLLHDDKDGHDVAESLHREAMRKQAEDTVEAARKRLEVLLSSIEKKYKDEFGEGRRNPEEAYCQEIKSAKSAYLLTANNALEVYYNDAIKASMRRTNDEVYFQQYIIYGEASYESFKAGRQLEFLYLLNNLGPVRLDNWYCKTPEQFQHPKKLLQFDDIHCENKVEISCPGLGTATFECSKLTTDFTLGPVSAAWKEDLNSNQLISGTAEVGFSKTVGKSFGGRYEPLKAELKETASFFIEFDNSGITDGGLKVGASAGVSTDFYDNKITLEDGSTISIPTPKNFSTPEAGVMVRYGFNSGISTTGKGILSGLTFK